MQHFIKHNEYYRLSCKHLAFSAPLRKYIGINLALTTLFIIYHILNLMEKPFDISDLFIKLDRDHNITNKTKILFLSILIDSGLVDYSEIKNSRVNGAENKDYWAYRSILTMA